MKQTNDKYYSPSAFHDTDNKYEQNLNDIEDQMLNEVIDALIIDSCLNDF